MQGDAPTLGAEEAGEPALALEALGPGSLVGRYAVLDELGRGGMGIVFGAYDPQLDRKIALKLLRTKAGETATARLLREAQALARVTHPNVCTVHDVGTFGDSVFVAMEYLEGETLGVWQQGRDIREVVAIYRQAAQGLMAAHAVGLVHRDFKPDNVIVGGDGRVRVLDFGLARAESDEELPVDGEAVSSADSGAEGGALAHGPTMASAGPMDGISRSVSVSAKLTQVGAVVGTPAYMPPEQFRAEALDPRADQFSFCVSLYEALYQAAPYDGEAPAQLYMNIEGGHLNPAPAGAAVPSWIRAALVRGLKADAQERWPTMEELVTELGRDPSTRRRRAVTVALAGVLAIGAVGGYLATRDNPAAQCSALGNEVDAVVTPARLKVIEGAFGATGKPFAADAYQGVERAVSRYAEDWRSGSVAACRATLVDHRQSLAVMDLRTGCFRRARNELQVFVEVLEGADEAVVENAVQAALDLRPLSECDDIEGLMDGVAPPATAELQQKVADVDRALDAVRVRMRAGQIEGLDQELLALAARAQEADYPPLEARLALVRGGLAREEGRAVDARTHLRQAFRLAVSHRDDRVAVQAAVYMATVLSFEHGTQKEALLWAEFAETLAGRRGDLPEDRHAVFDGVGIAHFSLGNYEASIAAHEAALDMVAAGQLGPNDEAVSLLLLGNALVESGAHEKALGVYQRALKLRETYQGPRHPATSKSLNNMGIAYERMKRFPEAISAYERSLDIKREVMGPDHPSVGASLGNLGNLALLQKDGELGRKRFEEALKVFEGKLAEDHPFMALCQEGLGRSALLLNDMVVAEEKARWLIAKSEEGSRSRGKGEWLLAESLAGSDPATAKKLARGARDLLDAQGRDADEVARIDIFLGKVKP